MAPRIVRVRRFIWFFFSSFFFIIIFSSLFCSKNHHVLFLFLLYSYIFHHHQRCRHCLVVFSYVYLLRARSLVEFGSHCFPVFFFSFSFFFSSFFQKVRAADKPWQFNNQIHCLLFVLCIQFCCCFVSFFVLGSSFPFFYIVF